MKKSFLKKTAVLVCILQLAVLFSAAPAGAASILRDGMFETLAVGGTLPSYWHCSGVTVQAEEVHTGARALQFTPDTAAATLRQFTASGAPVPGETYIASFWVKRTAESVLTLRYSFINASNTTISGTSVTEEIETTADTWELVERSFTVHTDAARLDFLMQAEGAPLYVDNIYCITAAEDIVHDTPAAIYGGTGENPLGMLACNMDFETVANTSASNMWAGIEARRTDSISHGGDWSYHVSTAGDIALGTTVTRNKLAGGATYQVVLWLNVLSSGGTIQLKPEFYKDMTSQSSWPDNASDFSSEYSRNLEPMGDLTYGKWRRVVRTFSTPPDAAALRLFIRTFGSAEFYVDDISITQISAPVYGKLETDAGVYYADMAGESGTASLRVNTISYPALSDASVTFRLISPDGTVLFKEENVAQDAENTAEFAFPLSYLTVRKTAYTVEADICADGTVVDTRFTQIYSYNRPTMLDADGNCRIDGKPFQPLVGYHIKPADYKAAAAAGINVVQSYSSGAGAALEAAEAAGIKVLLVTYGGMKPAGHPENITATTNTVRTYKDHPALFGYAVMDEPTVYFQDPSEYLMASYKAIRDIDDVHPIWIVEGSATYSESGAALCSKYCDIFAIDHYVSDAQNAVEVNRTKYHIEKTRAAIAPGRPLYALLDGGGVNSSNAPASIRNQGWQAFLGGADAIGYYMLSGNINTNGLLDAIGDFCADDYSTACSVGKQTFSAESDGDVLYRAWVENGKTYTFMLNQTNETNPTAQIPCGEMTVTCTVALGALEVRLWVDEEMDVLAAGECSIVKNNGADRPFLAGLYERTGGKTELVRLLTGADAVSLQIPEKSNLLLQVMSWDDGLVPLRKAYRMKTA